MERVITWIIEHWGLSAFLLTIVIQFTPAIKWNPLTALAKWISSVITNPLRKDIAEIKSMVEDQQRTRDEDKKDTIRWEILNFATSCRNGVRHTKDDFEHVITQNDKYHKLLEKTGDTNGVFDEEYSYILRIFHERQEKNDFL